MLDRLAKYGDLIMRGREAGPQGPARRRAGFPVEVRLPDLEETISEARYLVFDTELTGMKARRDSIVSIGAVPMTGTRVDIGESFSRVVEPRTELTGTSVVIHRITPTEASQSPAIEDVLPEFLQICSGRVIVGHVVSMDLRFINRELERLYGAALALPAVDTMSIYGFLRKKEGDYCAFHEGVPGRADLFSLAGEYDIPVTKTHHALYDAFITAQLLQRFLNILPQYGVRTVRDLRRIGKP